MKIYTHKYKMLVIFFVAIMVFVLSDAVYASENPNTKVKERVQKYFEDIPILIEIAKCETTFRQYTLDGNTLYGGYKNHMIGLMQFSEYYHRKVAKDLGYDIMTLEGNMGYAKYVYKREGTIPWRASEHCWGKSAVAQKLTEQDPEANSSTITRSLIFGMVHPQVKILQRVLNEQGFTVASEGGGSPGHETSYFGSQTRKAVQALQCKNNIVCDGNESTNGYGFVGKQTRPLVNSFIHNTDTNNDNKVKKKKQKEKNKEENKQVNKNKETKKIDKNLKKIEELKVQIQLLMRQLAVLQASIKSE